MSNGSTQSGIPDLASALLKALSAPAGKPNPLSVSPPTPRKAQFSDVQPASPNDPQVSLPVTSQPGFKPRDPAKDWQNTFASLLGMVPQVAAPKMNKAVQVITALAPLAAGVARSMSGPRYRRNANFLAGIAQTAPEAAVSAITMPAATRAAQSQANLERYKMASDVLKGMAPWMRTGPMVTAYDANGNPIYVPSRDAAGMEVAPKPTNRNLQVINGFVDGKPTSVYVDEKSKRLIDMNTQQPVSGFVKTQGQVRPGEWVQDENGNWGHVFRDQQGKIANVEFSDNEGHALKPPSGYLPTETTRQQVVQVQHEDGSIDYELQPIMSVTQKSSTGGSGKSTAPAVPKTPRIFAQGGKKNAEEISADVTDQAKTSIDAAESALGKNADNGKKRDYALADWNAVVEEARKDPDSPYAKRILAMSPKVETQIRQRYPLPQSTQQLAPGTPEPPAQAPNYKE